MNGSPKEGMRRLRKREKREKKRKIDEEEEEEEVVVVVVATPTVPSGDFLSVKTADQSLQPLS